MEFQECYDTSSVHSFDETLYFSVHPVKVNYTAMLLSSSTDYMGSQNCHFGIYIISGYAHIYWLGLNYHPVLNPQPETKKKPAPSLSTATNFVALIHHPPVSDLPGPPGWTGYDRVPGLAVAGLWI